MERERCIYIYIDIPLQALTYLSHILGQKPLRVGPRQCPRQCVEGGVILYVVRVVQILALGGGVNTCFAYIYVGFE